MTLQETLKQNQQVMRKHYKNMQQEKTKTKIKEIIFICVITMLLFLVLIWLFQDFSSEQQVSINNCLEKGYNIDYCVKGVI